MSRPLAFTVLVAMAALAIPESATAQGVELKRTAVVLAGSDANCSKPGTIDYAKVRSATSQWKTIRSEGVRPGSARYQILSNKMMQVIRAAAAAAAGDEGVDLVVRKGDITDDRGLDVVDLTSEVIDSLDHVDG